MRPDGGRYKAGNLDSASGCDRRGRGSTCFSARPTVWERAVAQCQRVGCDSAGSQKCTATEPHRKLLLASLTGGVRQRGGGFGCEIINFARGVEGTDWSFVRFKWRRRRSATPPLHPSLLYCASANKPASLSFSRDQHPIAYSHPPRQAPMRAARPKRHEAMKP